MAAAYPTYPDQELAALLTQGDQRAFAELYERYSQRIYTTLRHMLKDELMAEELLQEVFVKLWEKRSQLRIEVSFRAYLYRVAENQARDYFRRVARDKKLIARLAAAASEFNEEEDITVPDNEQLRPLFEKAVAALPPQRQKVFTLCKLHGLSYEQAASQLGITTATVNDHIVKATKSIRTAMHTGHAAVSILTAVFMQQLIHRL